MAKDMNGHEIKVDHLVRIPVRAPRMLQVEPPGNPAHLEGTLPVLAIYPEQELPVEWLSGRVLLVLDSEAGPKVAQIKVDGAAFPYWIPTRLVEYHSG